MRESNSPIEIEIFDGIFIDAGIARYIKIINKLGYLTKMSCSGMKSDGHIAKNGNRPHVSFDRPISPSLNVTEYFKVLASCFIKLNKLEEDMYPINPEKRIFWYLSFQPHASKNPEDLQNLTTFLPLGLKDEQIRNKFEELVQILKKIDYFNKLSEKAIENGEEIIVAL